MPLPTEPVTLSVAQIRDLQGKLSALRHDANNKLTLIAGKMELIRRRPEDTERLLSSLGEHPKQISDLIAQFSKEVEAVLGITRS